MEKQKKMSLISHQKRRADGIITVLYKKKQLYNTAFFEFTHNYFRRTYLKKATYYTNSRK